MATWAEFFLVWNEKHPYPPLGQEQVTKVLYNLAFNDSSHTEKPDTSNITQNDEFLQNKEFTTIN